MLKRTDTFLLYLVAIAAAFSILTACTMPPDEVADDDVTEDPTISEEPDAPDLVCGLQLNDVEGNFPIPPDWTNGHPFAVDDYVGYADTVSTTFFAGLMIRIFDEGRAVQEHWLASYDLRSYEAGSFAQFLIHDVKVLEGIVEILWQGSVTGPDGSPDPYPAYGLTTIMPSMNLVGTSHLPQLMWQESHSSNHRLAFDENGDLHLGSYDYRTGDLTHRKFIKTIHGYAFAFHQPENIHQLPDIWQFSILNSFSVENDAFKYLVGGPLRAIAVSYRDCN